MTEIRMLFFSLFPLLVGWGIALLACATWLKWHPLPRSRLLWSLMVALSAFGTSLVAQSLVFTIVGLRQSGSLGALYQPVRILFQSLGWVLVGWLFFPKARARDLALLALLGGVDSALHQYVIYARLFHASGLVKGG